jgi:hypothetical protein
MDHRWLRGIPCAVAAAVIAVVPACAESSDGESSPDAGDDSSIDQASTDGKFGDSSSTDAGCPNRCSSDLHQILDCHGAALRTCPDDQGCNAQTGTCVFACESAKAAKTSIGCDFYSMQPINRTDGCFAAFIANTWSVPVTIGAELEGKTLDVSTFARLPSGNGAAITYEPLPDGKVPPGKVAILFLVNGPGCPGGITPPADGPDMMGTSRGAAFHLTADRPVTAYDIYPYGGGEVSSTSATLLLATSSWGTNYVAVDPYGLDFGHGIQVVAQEDGTDVTILPTVLVNAGSNIPTPPAGQATTYSLKKGEVVQFFTERLLGGSIIESTKPVGMWTGAPCENVEGSYCDSIHQQIPHVSALGSEYVAVRYRNRNESKPDEAPPWQIMGLVDGTRLVYDPAIPTGAPTTLSAGESVKFFASGPFVVRSQDDEHPFYVAGYMTGCGNVGEIGEPPLGCPGDPELVNVVPTRQYLSSYVFFTDPTYSETNLVVVRSKAEDGTFKDVTLDCRGPLGGWTAIGGYEYTRVDLVRNNFEPQSGCDNGAHTIRSDAPFTATVWGWGSMATGDSESGFYTQAVSYAYPVGQGVRPINDVKIPPIPK